MASEHFLNFKSEFSAAFKEKSDILKKEGISLDKELKSSLGECFQSIYEWYLSQMNHGKIPSPYDRKKRITEWQQLFDRCLVAQKRINAMDDEILHYILSAYNTCNTCHSEKSTLDVMI